MANAIIIHGVPFDPKDEARKIIIEHTNGYMQSCKAEFESVRDLMEVMYAECSYILTDYLLEKKYTPMQYNAVRNELGAMIWDVFKPHIKAEDEACAAELNDALTAGIIKMLGQ